MINILEYIFLNMYDSLIEKYFQIKILMYFLFKDKVKL